MMQDRNHRIAIIALKFCSSILSEMPQDRGQDRGILTLADEKR